MEGYGGRYGGKGVFSDMRCVWSLGGRRGVFSGRRTRSVWWEEWGVFREED